MDNQQKRKVKTSCEFFPLDRPCPLQKHSGQSCDSCIKYRDISGTGITFNILIVKLGAMGDVLRTTFLLEGLKELYPKSKIHWICAPQNTAVLVGNKYIDSIINFDAKTCQYLVTNYFDLVINLDLSPESLALATLAMAEQKAGYYLDSKRNIISSNSWASQWLSMSAYDDIKKANTHTYQYWMSKITGLLKDSYEIIAPLAETSVLKAQNFAKENNIDLNGAKIIGINPGAGKRWVRKKWLTSGFIETAKFFAASGHKILLLGGAEDKESIDEILNAGIEGVYSTGTDNSVADFFAMLNLCSVVLSGDTMAMHAALGLKKNVVAIFGPTSAAEIELYGRGTKIVSPKPCACCYKSDCFVKPTCMHEITSLEVIEAVKKYL
ncbi:MAG: glycosyltransferase family 9 protein [Elusimicrobia bacterium]|nr:glycosyltransferase family 9 protein [Elusimicrobiota bacterium]